MGTLSWILAGVGIAMLKIDAAKNLMVSLLNNIPVLNSVGSDWVAIGFIVLAVWLAQK